jgi:type IV secretory pathway VirJ component
MDSSYLMDSLFVLLFPVKEGHHFGGDYEAIAETILNDLK